MSTWMPLTGIFAYLHKLHISLNYLHNRFCSSESQAGGMSWYSREKKAIYRIKEHYERVNKYHGATIARTINTMQTTPLPSCLLSKLWSGGWGLTVDNVFVKWVTGTTQSSMLRKNLTNKNKSFWQSSWHWLLPLTVHCHQHFSTSVQHIQLQCPLASSGETETQGCANSQYVLMQLLLHSLVCKCGLNTNSTIKRNHRNKLTKYMIGIVDTSCP